MAEKYSGDNSADELHTLVALLLQFASGNNFTRRILARRIRNMAESKYQVAIANQQTEYAFSVRQLRTAVKEVLAGEKIRRATVSIAIVDDPTMHQLNRKYLKHDYPTDVLSFVLEQDDECLDGEIILSADTAASSCGEYGWSAQDELTLYAIHGTLHLVGYDDHSPADRRRMRAKEEEYLGRLGIQKAKSGVQRAKSQSRGRKADG